ncbi:1-acyl-sn-glycerol-3-phosphate acyltransferase [Oleiphilus sp. HI0066]|uniref:1-acyl-sn-glycerol-3-phosphate acyltransferase n=4 Tax=unclassified Oleiphilus TaxID=2631174 RepID=UPI0009EE1B79|nr:1-acyl-sn-glycerol-3-phosphate acyltransferase [Oleiphilus sp. HI0066]
MKTALCILFVYSKSKNNVNNTDPSMLFDQTFKSLYESVRCFDDSEVDVILQELHDSTRLSFVLGQLFPGQTLDTTDLYACSTIAEIQDWLITRLVPKIEGTYSSLTSTGLDQLDPNTPYVFISNHRDIVLDPVLINTALYNDGRSTVHSAIGDNLLLSKTATRMALLNKCFRVNRSVTSPKALLRSLKLQSSYISEIIHTFNESVWLAQREGRAINNIDTTNPALIKMMSLSKPKTEQLEYLNALKIVPITLSYEWDPCDQIKAKRIISQSKSTVEEKLASDKFETLTGIIGSKGQIHVHFGAPVSLDGTNAHGQDIYGQFASKIDREMHCSYRVFPINSLCDKLVHNNYAPPADLAEEEQTSLTVLNKRLSVTIEDNLINDLAKQVIQNYAQASILQRAALKV